MEAEVFAGAIGVAGLVGVLLGASAYARAARVARGRSDSRLLAVGQVVLVFCLALPLAPLIIVGFLSGHPIRAVVVFVAYIGSSLCIAAGTRVAWGRYGKPDQAGQLEAQRAYRLRVTTARSTSAWLSVVSMGVCAVLMLGVFWVLSAVLQNSPQTLWVLGVIPPAAAMGISGTTMLASKVRAKQPFAAAVVLTLLLAPICLAHGFYSAAKYPENLILPGWTQMCTFFVLVSLGTAFALRSITRKAISDELAHALDPAQLTSASS